jgi:hypothetical protein
MSLGDMRIGRTRERTERLLLECEEDGVDKLDVLEVIVDDVVEF